MAIITESAIAKPESEGRLFNPVYKDKPASKAIKVIAMKALKDSI